MEKELLLEIKEKIGAIREQLDELEKLVLRAEGIEEPNVNASVMPKFWELPSSNSFDIDTETVVKDLDSEDSSVVLEKEKTNVLEDSSQGEISENLNNNDAYQISSVSNSVLSEIQSAISSKVMFEEKSEEKFEEKSAEEVNSYDNSNDSSDVKSDDNSVDNSDNNLKEEAKEEAKEEVKEEVIEDFEEKYNDKSEGNSEENFEEVIERKVNEKPKTINERTESRKSIMESLMAEYTWMTDVPRSRVKNIHSSISLGDRALFTRELFGGNATLYRDNIGTLNEMPSFESALEMLQGQFPEWDLKSNTVYRFMMAVRSKLG